MEEMLLGEVEVLNAVLCCLQQILGDLYTPTIAIYLTVETSMTNPLYILTVTSLTYAGHPTEAYFR
jgi:hypothetical protein